MRLAALTGVAVLAFTAPRLDAATFDARGILSFDPTAVATQSFEGYEPLPSQQEVASFFDGPEPETGESALHGAGWVRFGTNPASRQPFEVDLALPAVDSSYRFRSWVRHGRVWARAIFEYGSGREDEVGYLFPSGRVTSDGWTELVSNPVSVTGTELSRGFLRFEGSNVDLDAIEVVPEGTYRGGSVCSGAFDPVCGDEAVCMAGFCRQGDRFVPPLPAPEYRDGVADYLIERVRWLFGGHLTRTRTMPAALAEMDRMKSATTAWQFWGAFSRGIRMLHDWHSSASSAIGIHRSKRHLSVCFIEGRGDLTQTVWPSDPARSDVLVSHADPNPLGIEPGDRLVAVDGVQPLEWARSLVVHDWGYHSADDPDVDAEFAEGLRDLIPTFARAFSVIHCDAATTTCDDVPTTYAVEDIPEGGFGPFCDNRPFYHQKNPPPSPFGGGTVEDLHLVHDPWVDEVVDSGPGEHIYGMTWDNLNQLGPFLRQTNDLFRREARGVILDHRAGNGGTIDGPAALSELVRKTFDLSVGPGFMTIAGYDGPFTEEEGIALFERYSAFGNLLFRVGSENPDLELPVALITHRDGSASDWLPHGMKGAPNVRTFGPHETAGAFSSFYQYSYWSRFDFQLASGDTITFEGKPLIGHGIEPDVVVEHTQTSLLEGRDAPYEAALEWVRGRLAP